MESKMIKMKRNEQNDQEDQEQNDQDQVVKGDCVSMGQLEQLPLKHCCTSTFCILRCVEY